MSEKTITTLKVLLIFQQNFNSKISKSILNGGDLVVVRSGSVGVTCVIPDSLGEANCSDLVIIKRSPIIISEFGAYFMNSIAKRNIRAGQVGIALVHFNTKSVASLSVPVPPIEEQLRIVEEVERRLSVLQELEQTIEANLKRAGRLRQAILKRAFEGRLV